MVVYQEPGGGGSTELPPSGDPDSTYPAPAPTGTNGACPPPKVETQIRSDGTFDSGFVDCVTSAEAARRRNINYPDGSGSTTKTGGAAPSGGTAPFSSTTKPYQFTPWKAPAKTPFETDLQTQISDFLKNYDKSVPYTPEVISNMRTDAFRDTYGRTNANKASIQADAIQRGVLRSTGTERRLDNRANAADAAYAQGNRDITNVSTKANFEAVQKNRLDALDRAQNHLDREREYLLASETNDFRRQEGLAKLAFAYYGLEQERWALTQNINNSNYQFGQTMDYNKLLLQWQILNGVSA